MNLDDQYNPAHREAVNLQGKFHDFVKQGPSAYDPEATLLQHEIHELVGELESKRSPQDVENRIKIIQREIRQAQMRGDPIMHYDHLGELHRHYESLRQQVRKMNY